MCVLRRRKLYRDLRETKQSSQSLPFLFTSHLELNAWKFIVSTRANFAVLLTMYLRRLSKFAKKTSLPFCKFMFFMITKTNVVKLCRRLFFTLWILGNKNWTCYINSLFPRGNSSSIRIFNWVTQLQDSLYLIFFICIRQ